MVINIIKAATVLSVRFANSNASRALVFLSLLAAPARRVLERALIETLAQLSTWREPEVLRLHGMGPSSMTTLRLALKLKGLSFRK